MHLHLLVAACSGDTTCLEVHQAGSYAVHAVASSRKEEAAEAMKILLRAKPAVALQRDGRGRLPLHLCLETAPGPSVVEMAKQLVIAAPEAVALRDAYENTPLFLALQLATGPVPPPSLLPVVAILLQACPNSACQVASYNKTPLHLIAPGVTALSIEVAREVFRYHPKAARTADRNGIFAHQYAQTEEMRSLLTSWFEATS